MEKFLVWVCIVVVLSAVPLSHHHNPGDLIAISIVAWIIIRMYMMKPFWKAKQ
jgi:hypothetical protein